MKYTIQKAGVTLDFSTWTFSKFCERNGNMTLTDFGGVFTNMTPRLIQSLLLCGAENHHRKSKAGGEFIYNMDDAADWVDDLGGLMGEDFAEMFGVIAQSITPQYQGAKVTVETEEKKSQEAGMISV